MDRDYKSLVPSFSGMDFQGQDIRDLYNTYLGDQDKSRDEPLVRDGELFFFDQYDEYRTSHGGDDLVRRNTKQIPNQSHSGPVYQDYQQQGKVLHSSFDTKRDSYGFPMSNAVNFGQTQYTSQYDNTRVDSYCPSYQEQQPSSPHYVHGKLPGIQQPRQG
ncbi:hypothetical protein Pcinc_027687 [Petrolisthes cinctipes]|uniref:Uncharacterized protein n=1 Tax=Petrolisthes cinctipes TaxID=88211 RepID=A0AAE1F3M0_PETCI|nr:hypothetical protein Pcinc_027687 [Petrolisthes cinctipes]